MVVLTSLRWFPVLAVVYTGALAALHQRNYTALRSIAVDARVRDPMDGRVPFIARAHPWRPFSRFEVVPQLLAFRASGVELNRELAEELIAGSRGKRYTPVSDYLHDMLRNKFRTDLPDDAEYSELFDRAEALLALIAIDADSHLRRERTYFDGPYFGRFTWREQYMHGDGGVAGSLARELSHQGEQWGPLRAGLFGGSLERATVALQAFRTGADEARRHRW